MLPRLAFTMGDVAGIGPEVVVQACLDPRMQRWCRPVVFGRPEVIRRAAAVLKAAVSVKSVATPDEAFRDDSNADADALFLPCVTSGPEDAVLVRPGELDARAGRAAYECLVAAANAALAGDVDGVVTAPLNKAALKLAGLEYPGHTEILAELSGSRDFAMMLYLPSETDQSRGLGVAHVTLHTSIRSVPDLLTTAGVLEKIVLLDGFLKRVGVEAPRVGVCALNPHGGEQGLFGDEEQTVIEPAVREARAQDVDASGPIPADALMRRAVAGEFDGVTAMYHDQGHIALKLVGFDRAVNVTLGLPIIRTSPSHGTAFDIAWQGKADASGMIAAVDVAAKLVHGQS